jgi:glycosyltransferase involved in cell wall biosynthesis
MRNSISLPVTPLVLTYNEERNIRRTLESLRWAERVVVLDSSSTDVTESVARCLRRVYQDGVAGMRAEADIPACTQHVYRTPRNRQMLLFLICVVGKMLFVRFQEMLGIDRNHWFIGVACRVTPDQQLDGKVKPLRPPEGRFWADPMIVRKNGQTCMFFEDYDYSLGRAHISVVDIDAGGCIGVPQIALKADHHLSYPFVFDGKASTSWFPKRRACTLSDSTVLWSFWRDGSTCRTS